MLLASINFILSTKQLELDWFEIRFELDWFLDQRYKFVDAFVK